jgi:hypothetical protein
LDFVYGSVLKFIIQNWITRSESNN